MIVYQSSRALDHRPTAFFRRGKVIEHPESAERYAVLIEAVRAAGHELKEPDDFGLEPIAAVHAAPYLDFLRTAWARRAEVAGVERELVASHFARPDMQRRPDGLTGQLGYYTSDTSTPVLENTWEAIYGTAQAAVAAADAALAAGWAFALCRPPGHHASASCAGGFCYLNNAAIAAQRFAKRTGARVAVLDIDVHHGNGTQAIFYERADVFTVSIHGNPSDFFPFFSGYADEKGAGLGEGFNLNLPVALGGGDRDYLGAVEVGLERIVAFRPAAMVISLGLDAAAGDPLGAMNVTTEGFRQLAAAIAALDVPTVIVQEGGYLCPALPRNLAAFLMTYDCAREGTKSLR